MRNYTFRYVDGSSGPERTIPARNDHEFYAKLEIFLSEKPGRSLIKDTIRFIEHGDVADPPITRKTSQRHPIADKGRERRMTAIAQGNR